MFRIAVKNNLTRVMADPLLNFFGDPNPVAAEKHADALGDAFFLGLEERHAEDADGCEDGQIEGRRR